MDISVFIEILTIVFNQLCVKRKVEPKNVTQKIVLMLDVIPGICMIFSLLRVDAISSVLRFLQRYWGSLYVWIIGMAVLPAVLVVFEKEFRDSADKEYIYRNLGFNLCGALSACAMLFIVRREIKDICVFESFY